MKKYVQFISEGKGIYQLNLRDLIVDEFNELNLPYSSFGRKPEMAHRISREERLRKLLEKKYISFYYDIRGLNHKPTGEDGDVWDELISGVCETLDFKEEVQLNNKPVRDVLTVTIKHVDEDNEIFNYNLDWTRPVTVNEIRKITKRFDL